MFYHSGSMSLRKQCLVIPVLRVFGKNVLSFRFCESSEKMSCHSGFASLRANTGISQSENALRFLHPLEDSLRSNDKMGILDFLLHSKTRLQE